MANPKADRLTCDECGAGGEIHIVAKCHPREGHQLIIHGDLLTVRCAVCEKLICYFTIKTGPFTEIPQ